MTLGPLEYIVIGFQDNRFDGSVAREIEKVVQAKIIRLVDVALVAKDRDGKTVVAELDYTKDPSLAPFANLLGDTKSLFTHEDLDRIAESLPEGTAGAALLFEHRWAEDIREAMKAKGGFLVDRVVIPADVIEEVSAEIEAGERVPV